MTFGHHHHHGHHHGHDHHDHAPGGETARKGLFARYGRFLVAFLVVAAAALSACLVVSVAIWPVNLSGLVAGLSPPATYQQEFQSSVPNAISYAVSAFAAVPRGITMVLSVAGAILVVGGGILSFVLDRRRTYALVIALGALMDAVGGILLGIFGDPEVFFSFEFLGILFLFLGFLMSSRGAFRTPPVQGGQAVTRTA